MGVPVGPAAVPGRARDGDSGRGGGDADGGGGDGDGARSEDHEDRMTGMGEKLHQELSRRERQIMDALFRRGPSSAAEVREEMPSPPSYSAVRAQLRILEEKGHVRHEQVGPRYVYRPALAKEKATRSALRHMVQTFFNGSASQAMAALLDDEASDMSERELERLSRLIDAARDADAEGNEEEDSG